MRKIVDWISKVFLLIGNNRKIKTLEGSVVKLNVGSGLAVAPDWINIDASLNSFIANLPKPLIKLLYKASGSSKYYSLDQYLTILTENRFVFHNLAKGLPLNGTSVDFIYTSHFIEHLYKDEAVVLLDDCFRVLKKGGIMRIVLPDLKKAIDMYHSGKKLEMLEQYFFIDRSEGFFAMHKFMYDSEMLEQILCDIGFSEITIHSFQSGKTPDLAILDNRPEESFYLEAEK